MNIVDVETLADALVGRFRAYERAWDKYIGPPDDWPTDRAFMSRPYSESEKYEFIRTMAVLDRETSKGVGA